MLPIAIISLRDATDRRARAAAQMQRQGIAFEFFDACDGESGRRVFASCNEEQFVLHTGREITPGEIGCYASHKRLWQRCVDSNRPLLIMEDDFCLEPGFASAVRTTAKIIGELNFVRLQDERRGASRAIMPLGKFQLERYTKTPHCAMCYAITPRLARRWLELFQDFNAPVDVVLKHVWTFDNPMYCLTPYTVSSGDLSFDSMIGDRAKCQKCAHTRMRRTWLKIGWQWNRLVFNLRQSDVGVRQRLSALDAVDKGNEKHAQVPGRAA